MAKLKAMLDPNASHKAIGGLVYNTRPAQPPPATTLIRYAAIKTSPARDIPQSQRLNIARRTTLILASKELDVYQVGDWRLMKEFWEEFNWYADPKRITWLDFFIKFNTQRLRMGLDILMDPPLMYDRPDNLEDFTITPIIHGLTLSWSAPPPDNSVDLWLGWRQTSTSKADIHHARASDIVSGDGTPHTIGGLMAGYYHVFYRVLGELSGMPSTWASQEGHVS